MAEELSESARNDDLSGMPSEWRAARALEAAGISNPTHRQLRDFTAKLRAENPNAAEAATIRKRVALGVHSELNWLDGLGVGYALDLGEDIALMFLDHLGKLHGEGGELGKLARKRLLNFVLVAVARLDDLADARLTPWSSAPGSDVEDKLIQWSASMMRELAEMQTHWPVLLNQTGESVKEAEDRCRALNVGYRSGLNIVPKRGAGKKQKFLTTETNREALRQIDHIRHVLAMAGTGKLQGDIPWLDAAWDLPAVFDERTWRQWFAVGWAMLMHATGGHPERTEKMWRWGRTRAESVKKRARKQPIGGLGQRETMSTATEAAHVRDKIKDTLKKTYSRLVASPPSAIEVRRAKEA